MEEIKPHALQWEQDGMVPREVVRRMGELGFLGIRYAPEYGGSGLNTLATVVLAEELGRSTFAGVAITVLVNTDMAPVHLYNSGPPELKDRFMPDVIFGRKMSRSPSLSPEPARTCRASARPRGATVTASS